MFKFVKLRHEIDFINNVRKHSSSISPGELIPLIEVLQSTERSDSLFGYIFKVASDITNLRKTGFISGIQRATLEIHKGLASRAADYRFMFCGVSLSEIVDVKANVHPQIAEDFTVSDPLEHLDSVDALLLLDLNFEFFKEENFQILCERQVPIIANVYDVLPITNPDWFPPATSELYFRPWLEAVLTYSSDVIVNSETTLKALHQLDLFRTYKGKIHIAPLGVSEHSNLINHQKIMGQTLIVGTIEPRKGHIDVLNAFDVLESRNVNVTLHIVGRQGWMVEQIIERINSHPSLNRTLFWHAKCSDSELIQLYAESEVTLVASKGEGFGLPILEATSHGSRVVARDIPVFREVGGEQVQYFNSDAANLPEVWSQAINRCGTTSTLSNKKPSGYHEYAGKLLSILEDRLHFGNRDK